jgi:DNA-binding transcriptional MerR regulator
MAELWDIASITRRTGLTSRALRHYEARGLIRPLRAASGRRLYGAAELERIHQIIMLKRAGFGLTTIGTLLARGQHDLARIIDVQIDGVRAKAARLAETQALLLAVKARLARHEVLDPATLCQLIHDSQAATRAEHAAWRQLSARYMDESVQQDFERVLPAMACEFGQEAYFEKWLDLSERIRAAQPLATDGEAALGFVREWMALLAPFSAVASPAMWESARAMYDEVDSWRGQDGLDPGFDGEVWRFIRQATEAALARGADLGPVPSWFGQLTSREQE